MSLTLYGHPFSPYARSVHSLLLLTKLEHTYQLVDLLKGEQHQADYIKVSPNSNVPALSHGDFHIFESHSLMRYIVNQFKQPQYYGVNPKEMALLDTYLDWHQEASGVISKFIGDFVWKPLWFNTEAPNNKEERLKDVAYYLDFFERIFLNKGEFQYIYNHNSLSIADLTAVAGLTVLFASNFDFTPYPGLTKYLGNLLQVPEIRVAHLEYFQFLAAKVPNLNAFIKQSVA